MSRWRAVTRLIWLLLCCGPRLDRVERGCLVFARKSGCVGRDALDCHGSGLNHMRTLDVVEVSLIRNASGLVLNALIVLSGRMLLRRALDAKVSLQGDVLVYPRVVSSGSHTIFAFGTGLVPVARALVAA